MSRNPDSKIKDFALPIGHKVNTVSQDTFTIGLPFRQPIDLPDKTDFSIGLDLWFKETENRKLFSMFYGTLEYYPLSYITLPLYQNSLVLNLSKDLQIKNISKLNEPIPEKIIYKNVNLTAVKASLKQVILNAYTKKIHHPILTSIYKNKKTIEKYLDEEINEVDKSAAIEAILNDFGNIISFKLNIAAGDEIGEATTNTQVPQSPSNPFIPIGTHNVNIAFLLYDGSVLNPAYYIWQLLKDFKDQPNKRVNCLTEVGNNGNTYTHPLLNSTGLNIDLATPLLPRIPVTNPNINNGESTILFPVGNLGIFHGYERGNILKSKMQWRITNDDNLDFEVRLRNAAVNTHLGKTIRLANSNTTTNIIDVSPDPDDIKNSTLHPGADFNQRVTDVWNDWGTDINELCTLLQFPAEYIVSNIYQETKNSPRKLALETISGDNISLLQANQIDQAIINAYVDLDPEYELNIPPDPIPMDTAIKSSDSTLTWRQLLEIIQIVPSRMTPGLIQTSVDRANTQLDSLKQIYGNNSYTYFGVGAYPASKDYKAIFNWLLIGRHSILISIQYHKLLYRKYEAKLNMLIQYSKYNSGQSSSTTDTLWLLRYNDNDYPLYTSKYYNALRNNSQIYLKSSFYKSFEI